MRVDWRGAAAALAALACSGGSADGRLEDGPPPLRAADPAPPPAVTAAPFDTLFRRLESGIGGVLGLAAVHVESGRRIEWNGAETFPMASVVKLPIALAVLWRVDRGEIALGDTLWIQPADVRPGRNLLGPGPATVERLLALMLEESDNTAADVLMARLGGAGAVRARLAALDVTGVDVSRSEGRMLSDWAGLPPPPAGREWSRDEVYAQIDTASSSARRAAAEAWAADPRDSATPAGMADLLLAVHAGAGLSSASHARLIGHMERSYGANRIPGLLPPGTPAARKSGTVGATTNDVGIVTLPDGTHFAVVAFIRSAAAPVPDRERAIAEAARALYDDFLKR